MEKELTTARATSNGTTAVNPDDDIEMQHLVVGKNVPLTASTTKPEEGFFQRIFCRLDQHYNMKMLIRLWGPRLEFVVRLMLVSTFLEDSLSTVTQFTKHITQVGEQGYPLKWFMSTSPGFVSVAAAIALGIGVLAQLIGSICLLLLVHTDGATKALIGWVIAQPLLYAQLSNFEFVAESLSLVGGLLMLRAHLVFDQARTNIGNRMQLLGRLLLPMMYLYYTGQFLFSAFTLDETNSVFSFFSSLSMFVVNVILLISLVIGSMLVAAGLKSRVIALLLATFNLGFVFYQHPFFNMIRIKDGEWKYIEENMTMPHVVLTTDDILSSDFDEEQIYYLHRYYFFLGLSTSGALLLLAQFGPGKIAVQKDEIILPTRAQD